GHGYNVNQIIFAPFGDNPILISQITITNNRDMPKDLRWIEYWGCYMYQFSLSAFAALLSEKLGKHPREVLFIIGMAIFMIINMLNDPLIGQWQDNTDVKKWGSRRIVYIKYFSPFLVIAFALMWFPWSTDAATPMGQFVMFLHFLISI
ncbi:unnamed protein product, partial [marine sediment metagenome]